MGRQANSEGKRGRRIVSVELTDGEVDLLRLIRDYLEKTGLVRKQGTISAAVRFAIRSVANYVLRQQPKGDEHGQGA